MVCGLLVVIGGGVVSWGLTVLDGMEVDTVVLLMETVSCVEVAVVILGVSVEGVVDDSSPGASIPVVDAVC